MPDTPEPIGADADGTPQYAQATVALPGGEKEIVCGIFPTGKDPGSEWAGAYWALPDWEAVTVQVPAAVGVRVAPVTVHTSGVLEA